MATNAIFTGVPSGQKGVWREGRKKIKPLFHEHRKETRSGSNPRQGLAGSRPGVKSEVWRWEAVPCVPSQSRRLLLQQMAPQREALQTGTQVSRNKKKNPLGLSLSLLRRGRTPLQTGLELTTSSKLLLNSQQSSCLVFPSYGSTGVSHHTQPPLDVNSQSAPPRGLTEVMTIKMRTQVIPSEH